MTDPDASFKFGFIQCFTCRHLRPYGRCEAFPNGIPAEITSGEFDHHLPYVGDNGIRFEEIDPPKDPNLDAEDWNRGGDAEGQL